LVLNKEGTILDSINMLRCSYFFDIVASKGECVRFARRDDAKPIKINDGDLIKYKGYYISISEISPDNMLGKVMIKFIDQKNYDNASCHYNSEQETNLPTEALNLPISMSEPEAQHLGLRLIASSRSEKKLCKFSLPIEYMNLEPTDNVLIDGRVVRVTDVVMRSLTIEVEGVYA